MKKLFILALLGLMCTILNAQDYKISFAGSGESTTVDSVEVENINSGEILAFPGNQVLHLVEVRVGVNNLIKDNNGDLKIYPNPISESSIIEFTLPNSGKTNVEIFDVLGKKVVSTTNTLFAGRHSFVINGLIGGIYAIKVYSNEFSCTGKFISNNQSGSKPSIIYNGNSNLLPTLANMKSVQTDIVMQYQKGDRLKITGKSGIYRTIITEIPDQSKVILIPFIKCSDADGNNYSVVRIGDQYWTVENLKTTKYRDGVSIPNVAYSEYLSEETIDAYTNYDNLETNAEIYGRGYNWYAVETKMLAPLGWHVPTLDEWTILEEYLIANGYNYDGTKDENKIAKSLCAKTKWALSSDVGTPGAAPENNNSSGFTALPGFNLYFDGRQEQWWGTTESFEAEYSETHALQAGLSTSGQDLWYVFNFKVGFLSVRLVKD